MDKTTESGNMGMDKLFRTKFHENSNDRHRCSFAYKTSGNHLETMESAIKTTMGFAKVWNRKRLGKTDLIHGRPLPMDSHKNMRGQSDIKTKAGTGRVGQLFRLQ